MSINVAITTGTTENPRIVCIDHVTADMPVLGTFTPDDTEPTESCATCGRIFSGMIHVTINNPNDTTDMPIYDGIADRAHFSIIPGTYTAYGDNADEYRLHVTSRSTTVEYVGFGG